MRSVPPTRIGGRTIISGTSVERPMMLVMLPNVLVQLQARYPQLRRSRIRRVLGRCNVRYVAWIAVRDQNARAIASTNGHTDLGREGLLLLGRCRLDRLEIKLSFAFGKEDTLRVRIAARCVAIV